MAPQTDYPTPWIYAAHMQYCSLERNPDNINKKLSYHWQTMQRICANTKAGLT